MSREVAFAEEVGDFEVEDAISVQESIAGLEATLLPYLESEKTRLLEEVSFLKSVYSGITRDSPIELVSSIYVDSFLSYALRRI